MKDFRGVELHTDDVVAIIDGSYGGSVYLREGWVVRVTPKGARVGTKFNPHGYFVKTDRLVKL